MDRRAFLKTSAAAGAMLATTQGAIAETESIPGNTSVPLHPTGEGRFPLGPLPNTRYPDEHIEVIEIPFAETLDMIERGEIADAKTIALLYYARAKALVG